MDYHIKSLSYMSLNSQHDQTSNNNSIQWFIYAHL